MDLTLGRINIITGMRGIGKSSFCLSLVNKMEDMNISVAGLISPGRFVENKKIGIDVRNILDGDTNNLAEYAPGWDPERPKRMWKMNEEAISWGNLVLDNLDPCDVLIIDELGFLEFEKNLGWTKAFQLLNKDIFTLAFVVVRPKLVKYALGLWKESKIIKLTSEDERKKIEKSILDQLERIVAR
jgi:nucleoside-triphosphatase THEP1